MEDPERLAREFDEMFAQSLARALRRRWARPAQLPKHPHTFSDRHPDDPDRREIFVQYF
jgi:hypothetical protein